MAQPVREERRAHPAGHGRLRRGLEHAEVLEDAHQRQVRVHVQLPVVHPGAHAGAHRLLGRIHGIDHGLELAAAVGSPGAGDVGGIAAVAGAGIDQEAQRLRRRIAFQFGVVQHGGVLVEADDVLVGQFGGVLARGLAIGQVDVELAGAGAEGGFGGPVRAGGLALGQAHQRDLVGGLVRALVVQVVQRGGRVVGQVVAQGAVGLAQDRAARGRAGQQRQGLLGGADHVHVHVLDPPAVGRLGHHVPVVERLQVDHPWPLPGAVGQPAVGDRGQRQPVLEVRVDRERVVAVVEQLVMAAAAGDEQVVVAAARQRFFGACLQGGQVLRIERGGFGGVHRRGMAGKNRHFARSGRPGPACPLNRPRRPRPGGPIRG